MDDTPDPSSVVVAPAVFSLHVDLLLHIFHLNTYTPETEYLIHDACTPSDPQSPLTITRHTSQVCHAWRQTILHSPAIWGSVIDMTILEASSESWTEEVLKRTAESDLSIYGCVGNGSPSLFHSLLENNWHRVRRFDVRVSSQWDDGTPWATAVRVISNCPAPRLEKFLLRETEYPNYLLLGEFTKFAPSLRRYHCSFLTLDHRETWIAQLSSLTLSRPLNITDLRILGGAIHLESLVIMNTTGSTPDSDWDKFYLPKLVHLHIEGTTIQCLFFLQHIVGHPDCALVLDVTDRKVDFIPERFNLLTRMITPYTVRYFAIHQPPTFMIYVGLSTVFEFQTIKSTNMMYFAHPQTRLTYTSSLSRTYHESTPLRERILSILSSVSFGSTVSLGFNSHRELEPDPRSSQSLLRLMESLSSVQMLIVSPNSFKLLNSLSPNSALVLPLLRIIKVEDKETVSDRASSYVKSFPEDLLQFFAQRKVAGVPVSKLEITDVPIPFRVYDWRFLDTIEGLKVVWTRDLEEYEYICGTGLNGGKERLDWSKDMGLSEHAMEDFWNLTL